MFFVFHHNNFFKRQLYITAGFCKHIDSFLIRNREIPFFWNKRHSLPTTLGLENKKRDHIQISRKGGMRRDRDRNTDKGKNRERERERSCLHQIPNGSASKITWNIRKHFWLDVHKVNNLLFYFYIQLMKYT